MPSQIVFTIQDESSVRSNVSIDVPDGLTVEDYTTFANAAATQIAAITAGQILGASLSLDLVLSGAPFPAAKPYSRVEKKALFILTTENGFRKRMSVPALNDHVPPPNNIVNRGGSLNLSLDPGPGGFSDLLVNGDGTVEPTDSRGENLVSLITARKYFGRDRGRTRRKL